MKINPEEKLTRTRGGPDTGPWPLPMSPVDGGFLGTLTAMEKHQELFAHRQKTAERDGLEACLGQQNLAR
jgi:hypothetical protein